MPTIAVGRRIRSMWAGESLQTTAVDGPHATEDHWDLPGWHALVSVPRPPRDSGRLPFIVVWRAHGVVRQHSGPGRYYRFLIGFSPQLPWLPYFRLRDGHIFTSPMFQYYQQRADGSISAWHCVLPWIHAEQRSKSSNDVANDAAMTSDTRCVDTYSFAAGFEWRGLLLLLIARDSCYSA